MSSDKQLPGLPPVVPPSGRFIAQLFLVPGLIVAGAVVVLLGFTWLAGGNRGPAAFLRDLESGNPDIRWRTASDLAQVLKRDEKLAADANFGLELAELLKRALAELERAEATPAAAGTQSSEEMARERKETLARRGYIQYLCASLGNLITPVGAPVLADLARKSPSRDPKTDALLRRQAVWALATLGDNLPRFTKLSAENQAAMIEKLKEAAGGADSATADWARRSLAYFNKSGPLGAIDGLTACAAADDPFLRKQTAHALSFWFGTDEENKRAETTLLALAHDDGHGKAIELTKDD
jgi:hypothetical protein